MYAMCVRRSRLTSAFLKNNSSPHQNNQSQKNKKQGATRWMHHMGNTLCEVDLSTIDVRIKPCIIDFLRVKMKKYAKEHHWKYDEGDFDFVNRDKEMIKIYLDEISTLSIKDLPQMNNRELKRFLEYCDVDTTSCVEKSEFISLAENALLILIQKDLEALNTMSNKELVKLLENKYKIDTTNYLEKSEMLKMAKATILARAGSKELVDNNRAEEA
jgi:hypothetical protein